MFGCSPPPILGAILRPVECVMPSPVRAIKVGFGLFWTGQSIVLRLRKVQFPHNLYQKSSNNVITHKRVWKNRQNKNNKIAFSWCRKHFLGGIFYRSRGGKCFAKCISSKAQRVHCHLSQKVHPIRKLCGKQISLWLPIGQPKMGCFCLAKVDFRIK